MTYTLKVDWDGYRTQAVADVLAAAGFVALAKTLDLYIDRERLSEGSTIKVDWPPGVLDRVELELEHWLKHVSPDLALRARDNEPGLDYMGTVNRQSQVHAGLREIREYRAISEEVTEGLK